MKTAQKLKYPGTSPKVSKSRASQSHAYPSRASSQSRAYSSRASQSRVYPSRLKSKPRNHAVLAMETIIKIAINGGLSAVAIVTLSNLFPYYWEQRERVQAIRTEVRDAEYKVTRLRANLNRSFDPSQALNVMQDQSAMLAPDRHRIVLMDEAESR